jgi:colanic acid/amylovoran biosynthesis glycosyltransferase
MKIAYFINQYPKVSHSFIRREILALEAMGHTIERFALRSNFNELVDPIDQLEWTKTRYLLTQSKSNIIVDCFTVFFENPLRFLQTLINVCKIGWGSDRGVLRHLIYLIESCVLRQWQKQTAVEHIHAHFGTNSTAVVMFAHQLGGVGYSFTVHGPEEFDKPEFIALADKIIYSRFVIAISFYGRSQLFRWVDAAYWSKIKIVHCGLDEEFLNHQLTIITAPLLVCIGRLCEQKGQLVLLEAMRQLRDDGIKCQLILAGDGPMRAVIEQRIADYALKDCVQITGWISSVQVKQILLNAKGLVLASFAEGLPVVIMEAFALHKPVISTYIAGIPELVVHGKNGWLVPAGDIESLSRAMSELLAADSNLLAAMGNDGFNAVCNRHSIQQQAAKLAELFSEEIAHAIK